MLGDMPTTIIPSGTHRFVPNLVTAVSEDSYQAAIALKDLLLECGWSLVETSDGVTVSASDFAAEEDIRTDFAWFHVRSPSGHDFVFQRGSDGQETNWAAAVCDVPMTGGDATTRPSHADECPILGSGPGNFDTQWGADGSRYHIHGATVAENGVHAFSVMCRSSTGIFRKLVLLESFSETYDSETLGVPDEAKWVANRVGSQTTLQGWYMRNQAGESLLSTLDFVSYPQTLTFSNMNPNPYSGSYWFGPALIGEASTGVRHLKGKAANVMLTADTSLGDGDTINLTSEGEAFINWGNYMYRWPHNVAPVV